MEFCSLRENSITKSPIKWSYIYQEKERVVAQICIMILLLADHP